MITVPSKMVISQDSKFGSSSTALPGGDVSAVGAPAKRPSRGVFAFWSGCWRQATLAPRRCQLIRDPIVGSFSVQPPVLSELDTTAVMATTQPLIWPQNAASRLSAWHSVHVSERHRDKAIEL